MEYEYNPNYPTVDDLRARAQKRIPRFAFEYLDGPVMRVAAPDVPSMPFHPVMENYCLPNPTKIADALRKLAAY